MKPSKLKKHINTKHAKYSDKPIKYLETFKVISKTKEINKKFFTMNQKYLHAS